MNLDFKIAEGDGAFYNSKIDSHVQDSIEGNGNVELYRKVSNMAITRSG